MGLLLIGEFARASRLSPKALRLYDELGLLSPARTDPDSGYRLYDPAQLERARLISWLRQLELPLDRIREICGLDGVSAAKELALYWQQVEASTAARRDLAAVLIGRLAGGDTGDFDIAVRRIPERMLLTVRRHLTADRTTTFTIDLMARTGDGSVPSLSGIDGAPFLNFHGRVDAANDGPVEFCRPIPTDHAHQIAGRFPDLTLRREEAHREAYIRLPKARTSPADGLRAHQALEQWAHHHGHPQTITSRTIFIGDLLTACDDDPVLDVACALPLT